jgi:AraC-like DNA-binding protein
LQIVVCWNGTARVELDDGAAIEGSAAVVPADVPHALHTDAELVTCIYVEPEDARGRPIHDDAMAGRLDTREVARRLGAVEPPQPETWKRDTVAAWANGLLRRLAEPTHLELHPSVMAAIDYVTSIAPAVARLDEAAAETGVSPTRLTHVFTEEIGIPLRRFALWVRTKRAIEEFLASGSLTEAAHAAGFSDASHFCRSFGAMFGLRPSEFLGHARFHGSCHAYEEAVAVSFPTPEHTGCI